MTCIHEMGPFEHAFRCICCGRYSSKGTAPCYDCRDIRDFTIPKHVSFISCTTAIDVEGVCIFCASPAGFTFDTGEHICSRCRA